MNIIVCPNCKGTEFLAMTDWVFTQKFNGGKLYPDFEDIIKSKTVTKKVICQKCKKEVPKNVFKGWHLDQTVMK